MTEGRRAGLRALQGRRVTLALRNGTRIDDAQLVSVGSDGTRHLWLFDNGADTFVPLDDVLELWDDWEIR
ncbi:MAG TPA: hypothetical protein VGO87_12130 [Acidimicrobiia bacterium]|jgi:hypothetical protein